MQKNRILIVEAVLIVCLLVNSCESISSSTKSRGTRRSRNDIVSESNIRDLITASNELFAAGDEPGGFNRLYRAAVDVDRLQNDALKAEVAYARKNAWKKVSLQEIQHLESVVVGKKLSGAAVFSVRVNDAPAPAFPLAVAVKDDVFSTVTAEDGLWSVAPKTPEHSGIYRLSVRVDTNVFFANADFAADMLAFAATDPIVPAVKSDFRVYTADKTSPTSICIMDFDKNDKPIIADKDATASSLLFDLIVKKNFGAIGMSQFNEFMAKRDYNGAAVAADEHFGGTVRRFICGTTKIIEVVQLDDIWTVTASAEIYVYNLQTREAMLSITENAKSSASSENAAISTVWRTLGENVLADALYYGL